MRYVSGDQYEINCITQKLFLNKVLQKLQKYLYRWRFILKITLASFLCNTVNAGCAKRLTIFEVL